MTLKVEIRRNADGIVVVDTWKNWSYAKFWWEHGNAACDCNRALFFERAQGHPTPAGMFDCGHGAYSVRLTCLESKQVLYDEFCTEDFCDDLGGPKED